MKLRSISFRSFHHGQVGLDVETGGGDAPLSFRVVELHKFFNHIRKQQPCSVLNLRHAEFLEEDRDAIEELVKVSQEVGLSVWSESDGEDFPDWLSLTARRTVHITSEPWYQYRCNEIVFHMDKPMEPQVDSTHVQIGTALYVALDTLADRGKALAFLKKDPRPWAMYIPPRFDILFNLGSMDIHALGEEVL